MFTTSDANDPVSVGDAVNAQKYGVHAAYAVPRPALRIAAASVVVKVIRVS